VSLFLNLFLGIMLCLSRYLDLERLQTCKNEFDDTCTKWKSFERTVVEVIVTVITVSVPLVPIFNFVFCTDFKETISVKVFRYLFKSNVQDGDPEKTTVFGVSDVKTHHEVAATPAIESDLVMEQSGIQTGPINFQGNAVGAGSGLSALVVDQ
jgi:hypothetical protein